jgi:uncharacterized protein YegP (UPF0339 family)
MRTFIKLIGPPIVKAIRELNKIAINTPEVCVMDPNIATNILEFRDFSEIHNYFGGISSISKERCSAMISTSGEKLGDFNYYFQWYEIPTLSQIHTLYEMIDEALEPLGCRYKVVHSPAFDIEEKPITDVEAEETLAASIGEEVRSVWARFEVFRDRAGEFRFRLKAPNHRIIARSEGYKTKAGALNGIESVRKNAVIKNQFESFMDVNGFPRFRLRALNKEIIAASQAYVSKNGLEKGIQSVTRNAPTAEIIDLTKIQ